MRKYSYCYNCGNQGHIYKNCHYPIISLGVIGYVYDKNVIKLLMVRRKDSIGYTDFIRGKYNLKLESLLNIINIMTENEKKKILTSNFKKLWVDLWVYKSNRFENEYNRALSKNINLLKNGIIHNNKVLLLEEIIKLCNKKYTELEWGFPKGKRNKNEKDIDAALREFAEETNIDKKYYNLINIKPLVEDYIGTDLKKYRHIYYLAKLNTNTPIELDNKNNFQKTEISKIKLLDLKDIMSLIRPYNKERIDIVKSVCNVIKHISNI